MNVIRDSDAHVAEQPSVVGIGVFDGVHLGHQRVIATVRELADQRRAQAVIVTFDPHPARVLAPLRAPNSIATIGQRMESFTRLGVDRTRIITFTNEFASESAIDFIERVLIRELRVLHVVVGEDFHFGHDREGDVALLESEGDARGFMVTAAPIYGARTRWSSTVVRQALAQGNLELANATLGRPFVLRGIVEHGDARGGDLGFPTANLSLSPHQQLPALGIYAGAVKTSDATWWPAAISVGTRPQFYEAGPLLVEVHIPGFHGDLYDMELDVAFLRRLRGEMTFSALSELVAQMGHDVVQTLEIFKIFTPAAYPLLG
ncbi:MAG: bifunctional riboflavin kinase/FAD synthetase [Acidimicrobiaceae bacterium]|nr:bifunctional riboflavin kinase/FAD synthetase [Acidimicrobiaceae bacterium]